MILSIIKDDRAEAAEAEAAAKAAEEKKQLADRFAEVQGYHHQEKI